MQLGDTTARGAMAPLPSLRFQREGELRSRAARGDARAFARVYERNHQALYRYCRSLLRHEQDAQDALQNTMANAFAALQEETRDFDLRPWLFRIAHNESISILRRRRETAELDETTGAETGVYELFAEREDLRELNDDLMELPERQRAALVLRELNGLSQNEIAQVLGVSLLAVQQALSDARKSLAKCREGRAMDCEVVQTKIAGGDRRTLRTWHLRAHLRSCAACRDFRAGVDVLPRSLSALFPPMPVGVAAAILRDLLPSATAAGGWGAAVAGGGALAGKAIVAIVVVATAAGGAVVTERHSVPPPAAAPARTAAPTVLDTRPTSTPTSARNDGAAAPVAGTPSSGRTGRERSPATVKRRGGAAHPASTPTAGAVAPRTADTAAGYVETTTPRPVTGSGGALGNPGSAPGQTKKSESTTGPGNSGSAPGQTKKSESTTSPGNSGSAPGQTKKAETRTSPGNSGSAPGQTKKSESTTSPGNSGSAPGQTKKAETSDRAAAPGNSGSAPGHADAAPGHSGSAPGQVKKNVEPASSAPVQAQSTPAAAPGNSESAPGQVKKRDD